MAPSRVTMFLLVMLTSVKAACPDGASCPAQAGNLMQKTIAEFVTTTMEDVPSLVQVEVKVADEFTAKMKNTGFSIEDLATYMENADSTVEDGDGKVHTWSDFLKLYPSHAVATYPLKFRVDTTSRATQSHKQPPVGDGVRMEKAGAMLEEFKRKSSDPAFMMEVANHKEYMKKKLHEHKQRSGNVNMAAVLEGLDNYFAQKCHDDENEEGPEAQDCAEYKVCLKMSENIFGSAADFQHPSDDQVGQFVQGCKDEEAKVRADLDSMEDSTYKNQFLGAAAEILPKCEHVGKTMRAYLGSLGDGAVKSHSGFCTYMVNYVIPVDMEAPCQQFTELVKTEWMLATGRNLNWPMIVREEGFDDAFQKACDVDGASNDCGERLSAVKEATDTLMGNLESLAPTGTKLDTDAALHLEEIEAQYFEEVCGVLGYDLLHPGFDGANVVALRQRNTIRAQNALKFAKRSNRSKLLFGALAMAQMIDCAVNHVAYYHNVNVAGGFAAADIGAGWGYHDQEWVWFSKFTRVKTGMFGSTCDMVNTGGPEADAGVGLVRFEKFGNIAGGSVAFTVGGSVKGIGGDAGAVFCCEGSEYNFPHGCNFCGITVSPAIDAEGNDANAGIAWCYTHNFWELGPVHIPPPVELRNPFCFPGQALVRTSSGAKLMRDLRVGDRVLTVGSGDSLAFEDVYFFGHADQNATADYVGLRVGKEVLHLSGDHFVPICRSGGSSCDWRQRVDVYARDVKVGDTMWIKSSTGVVPRRVTAITSSHLSGVFNPYTTSGNIIVDGVVASCHSSWILDAFIPESFKQWIPAIYQMVFLPGRWIYKLFGIGAADFLDMNNPQAAPENFGYGPLFALFTNGLIPASLVTFLVVKRLKQF